MEMRQNLESRRLHTALLWIVIIFAVSAVIMGGINILTTMTEQRVNVFLGDGVFQSKTATTHPEREQGLSGVRELSAQEGMLLVFPDDDKWSIWMKGMHIPLDIIWLDDRKKVVHIEKNVQPDAEPYITYTPSSEARYVVELPAGSVQKYRIKMNEVAVFDLPHEKE